MRWIRRLFGQAPQIPDPLWQNCVAHLPFLRWLTQGDLARLKRICETLLDTKTITGAAGLEMTDEIAVSIAAQACLPILNLTLDLYRDMTGIVVYPVAFIVHRSEMDEAGVLHEWQEPLSGETMDAGGAVVLSWEDAGDPRASVSGQNVVIHEFVHKIDMQDGGANGCPPFMASFHGEIKPLEWQHAFAAAYDDLVRRVEILEHALPDDFDYDNPEHDGHFHSRAATLPLDPYAATDPAEFFAVASEAFFVTPERLRTHYPRVYALLSAYFRQTPPPLT